MEVKKKKKKINKSTKKKVTRTKNKKVNKLVNNDNKENKLNKQEIEYEKNKKLNKEQIKKIKEEKKNAFLLKLKNSFRKIKEFFVKNYKSYYLWMALPFILMEAFIYMFGSNISYVNYNFISPYYLRLLG